MKREEEGGIRIIPAGEEPDDGPMPLWARIGWGVFALSAGAGILGGLAYLISLR